MARNTRINEAQLRRIYWPSWRAAEKVLIAAGLSKEETDEQRKEIHIAVTGSDCSSKDLTNRTLDEVLRKFAAISVPRDGRRQAELADGPAKRCRWQIERLRQEMGLSVAYVEEICINMHRAAIAHCDDAQLRKVITALQYHAHRHPSPAAS
jgi:hypothetical protein